MLADEVDLDLLSWWQTRTSRQVERLRQVVKDQDEETWQRVPGRWTRDYVHALLTHLETAAPRSGGTGFAGSPVRSGSRPLRDVLTVPATRAAPVITLYLPAGDQWPGASEWHAWGERVQALIVTVHDWTTLFTVDPDDPLSGRPESRPMAAAGFSLNVYPCHNP